MASASSSGNPLLTDRHNHGCLCCSPHSCRVLRRRWGCFSYSRLRLADAAVTRSEKNPFFSDLGTARLPCLPSSTCFGAPLLAPTRPSTRSHPLLAAAAAIMRNLPFARCRLLTSNPADLHPSPLSFSQPRSGPLLLDLNPRSQIYSQIWLLSASANLTLLRPIPARASCSPLWLPPVCCTSAATAATLLNWCGSP